MGLAAGRDLPDEEHVNLSSLNEQVCSEYDIQQSHQVEVNETVGIPPEEEKKQP